MLKKNVYPKVGEYKLADIHRRSISDLVLDPILKRGSPVQANKVLVMLKQIFNYAVEIGYLEQNPILVITKKSVGGKERARSRVLSDSEIKTLWNGLDRAMMSEQTAIALKLLLVTGQRRGEVNSAKWSHFDLPNKCWTIPFENSKNRKEHKVPLSPLALSLIEELSGFRVHSEWVFPSKTGITPMTERVISRAANRAQETLGIEKWVPHDLRRTAATKMNEIGVAPHVVEKILNHTMTGVMAVYNLYEYWDEKVVAMDRWGKEIGRVIKMDQ